MESRSPLDRGTIWGILLISVGALFLLQTLDIIDFAWQVTIGIGFLVGAAVFSAIVVRDRRQWWAVFPAFALGFIGVMILLDQMTPGFQLGGSLFLGGLGLAFAAVYQADQRRHFWPIIPAGVLFTLALVAAFDQVLPWLNTGSIFFGGLAATFGYVWWETRQQQQWALVVAAVTGGLAVLILIGSLMRFLFPIALVAVGLYLLRNQRSSNGPQ